MKSFSRSTPSFATFSAISEALRQKVCEKISCKRSRASYRGPQGCQVRFPAQIACPGPVFSLFRAHAARRPPIRVGVLDACQIDVLLAALVVGVERTAVK